MAPVNSKVRESKIEREAVKYATTRGIVAIKIYSPTSGGWPDRLFIGHGPSYVFIEFKAPGLGPSKLQAYRIKLLRDQGCTVLVCDSDHQAREILDAMVSAPLPGKGDITSAFARRLGAVLEPRPGENGYISRILPPIEGTESSPEDAGDNATEADGSYVAQ